MGAAAYNEKQRIVKNVGRALGNMVDFPVQDWPLATQIDKTSISADSLNTGRRWLQTARGDLKAARVLHTGFIIPTDSEKLYFINT